MVRMSRTWGMRCRVTGSSVSSAAANAGSAEFFDPLVGIVPWRAVPPVITNLSMTLSYRALFSQGLRNAPARFGQPPLRVFAAQPDLPIRIAVRTLLPAAASRSPARP